MSVTAASASDKSVRGAVLQDLPPTSSWQDFEAVLKSSYVGTYAIYGTLPESKRQQVYSQAKQGGSINKVREYIVKARLSRG